MKNQIILSSIAIACLSTFNIAFANDIKDKIVVTAKGNQTLASVLPTSHVLTQEDIEAAQVKDLAGLLDRISGLSVTDSGGRGSVSGLFVRGASNDQLTILIDGVRIGSATLGSTQLNHIPIEAIERIEIVKGPLSGLYGADAVGGVIQIFTKKGGDGLGTATISVGSNGLKEVGLAINGGSKNNSFRISVNAEDSDGIDHTSILTDGNDDKDGYKEKAVNFAGKVTLSDNTTAQLSVLVTDNEVEFDNTFGADIGNYSNNKTLSTALNITSALSDSLRWTTILGKNQEESESITAYPSKFKTERDNLSSELAFTIIGNNIVTVGLDYYEEDIDTTSFYDQTNRDNKGIYFHSQSQLYNFGMVTNLRYDDNSAYDTETNGSIALNYNFSNNVRAVLSYGTSFSAPTFNDLYYTGYGNPDIKPEESESVELSVMGSNSTVNWRVSVYQTDIENLIQATLIDPDTYTYQASNVAEAEIKGLEFELDVELGNWLLDANLDLLSAEDKQTGIELNDRAERTLTLGLSRDFGKVNLRFDAKHESNRHDNFGTELSSYSLLDVSAAYQFCEKVTLFANIDNVFDKDYTVNLIGADNHYNTEGRQAKLTLKYNF